MSGGAIVVFWMLFRRRRADIPIGIFFSTTLHHERPRDCGFTRNWMRYTSVIVLVGTRVRPGRGGMLHLEQGRGWHHSQLPQQHQNDQRWHRTTRTEHRIYGILSVSRETCL